ncbi:MAG: hypothetical protein C6W56_16605 [Caldibacillus debilis]|nr:MAG: hypothetical protein C6W56_16605 [Caldibacillus debilis]
MITQVSRRLSQRLQIGLFGRLLFCFSVWRKRAPFFYAAAWLPAQGMRGAVGARSCGRERQNPLFSAVEGMPLIDKNGTFCL